MWLDAVWWRAAGQGEREEGAAEAVAVEGEQDRSRWGLPAVAEAEVRSPAEGREAWEMSLARSLEAWPRSPGARQAAEAKLEGVDLAALLP